MTGSVLSEHDDKELERYVEAYRSIPIDEVRGFVNRYIKLFDSPSTALLSLSRSFFAHKKAREDEIELWRKATALCEEHQPTGGVRSQCLVCSMRKLSEAISRIDYALGQPNEMEVSLYDVWPDEDKVVERAQKFAAEHPRPEAHR